MFPKITELFARFLMCGITGKILNEIFKGKTAEFKMFPFSTDSIYDNINITSMMVQVKSIKVTMETFGLVVIVPGLKSALLKLN